MGSLIPSPLSREVLVVDDEESVRRALGRLLESLGCKVHLAEDGYEALKVLEKNPIQLVLSDNDMPGMKGLDLLRQVRDRFPKVCRIMLTGSSDRQTILRAINENQIYRFVEKPWDAEVIATSVRLAFETLQLQHDLERERARSDQLLLNVLPQPIAERLKAAEAPIADKFDDVTILFSDIVGFTELSARMPPGELVTLLNEVFSEFDAIADIHGVEKIKTIGDAYMAVAGVPEPHANHAGAVCDMALSMIDTLEALSKKHKLPLQMRIGIHSGPVVAGVIGKRKFVYDLWGDTVNTASRMESHGVPGRVQVSETTWTLIRGRFPSEARGIIDVKGKGPMSTYLLKAQPSKASSA